MTVTMCRARIERGGARVSVRRHAALRAQRSSTMPRSVCLARLACLIVLLALAACTTDERDSDSAYSGDSLYSGYDGPYDFRYGMQLRYGDDYCSYHDCRSSP